MLNIKEELPKMMNGSLNIRQLYHKIITARAESNGVAILGDVKIPTMNSLPDLLIFDGMKYDYSDGVAFSFIGDSICYTTRTHPFIFNAMGRIVDAPKDAKKILKDYSVKVWGKLGIGDLAYYIDHQKSQSMPNTRISTMSGRIWTSVPSNTAKKPVAVAVFWCASDKVNSEMLKHLKHCFKSSDLFWSTASNMKYFNYCGDTFRETETGEIKELKSKIHPHLSHDEIVDILMRAHSNFKLSPFEQKVVWEFRGFDPSEVKSITGGYPSVAEYEYRKKLSESYNGGNSK